jgi:hypothetical protein
MRSVPARASSRHTFPIVLFTGLFSLATRDLVDPDFWWHLRTGELIWQTHAIPRVDPFSYPLHGKPWIAHEWLAELFFYGGYRTGGTDFLVLIFAGITALAYFFLYCRCSGKPYVAGLLTVLGAMGSVPTWGVRPQVLSLLFASLFLLIVDRAYAKPVLLSLLPILMLLWANLHGGFAVGLVILAAYWIGSLGERLQGKTRDTAQLPPFKTLSFVLVATSLAVLANPNGARLYRYPIYTLRLTSLPRYVSEWRPPSVHEPRFLFFFLILIVTYALISIRRSFPPAYMFLLLVLTTAGALRSIRHIPMFMLIAVPVLSSLISDELAQRRWARSLFADDHPSATKKRVNMILFATALLLFVFNVVRVMRRQPEIEAINFPGGAVTYLLTHAMPMPILNSYNWGGYFIWKLYPRYLVWVDGRTDLYGDAFMDDYAKLYKTQEGWRRKLEGFGIRTVVLPPGAPLAQALMSDRGWKSVYRDEQSAVFIRATPAP